jgi:16S rRNA (cytidine1402-2'-O)-methyltransferase
MRTLYVVSTPIGNLEDITLRALRVLGSVGLIAAEDTRTTRKLLAAHQISAPRLVSYNDHNMKKRIPAILDVLAETDVAIVSEAGTPGISDPGTELVAAAAAAGYRIQALPGASALTTSLATSGFSTRHFRYLGFLPRRKGERATLLNEASRAPEASVLFEAPHRLRDTLSALSAAFGDRRVAICRELTKIHEEIFRGTLAEALEHFHTPRGEFTIVIEGRSKRAADPVDIDAELIRLRSEGARAKDAVREVAEMSGIAKSAVYRRWIAIGKQP